MPHHTIYQSHLNSRRWWANGLLLCVAAVWGSSYGIAKYNVQLMPVLWFLALRFCLTFFALLPTLVYAWHRAPAQAQSSIRIGIPLGLVLFSIFVLETFGIAHTQASNAAFLISLCVVFTPFAEWGLLHNRPSLSIVTMVVLSLLGAALIVGDIHGVGSVGDLLIILAAIARALMVSLTQKRTIATPVNMLHLTAIQSGTVGMGCLLAAGLLALVHAEPWPALPTNPEFWFNTVYLVVFCTIFAFFVQNFAAKAVGATRTALLMGSEPLFGALFASMYLNEVIGLRTWAGGAVIVGVSLWVVLYRTTLQPRQSL